MSCVAVSVSALKNSTWSEQRSFVSRDGERVDSSTGTAERLDAVKLDRSRRRRAETTAARRAATAAARPMGAFSTAGARRLQTFVHYRSSHSAIVACLLLFSTSCGGLRFSGLYRPVMTLTFLVSRRRREMYCGHARLCVCVSARGSMPTLLYGPGCNLGE